MANSEDWRDQFAAHARAEAERLTAFALTILLSGDAPRHITKHHARLWRAEACERRLESCPRDFLAKALNHAAEERRAGRWRFAASIVRGLPSARTTVWVPFLRLP